MTGPSGTKRHGLGIWATESFMAIECAPRFRRLGTVQEITGLTVVSEGPPAQLGEVCHMVTASGSETVKAQVVGFRAGRVLLLALGETRGIQPGCEVIATGEQLSVPTGRELLGRVLDAFGDAIDGGAAIRACRRRPVHATAPRPMARGRLAQPIQTGVTAIDVMLTCAGGQRVGIFSGSGVGKSTLLGMIARNNNADVNVIALVGERGREVVEFVEQKLGPALARSVIVVATADEPPLVRLQAGFAATTIAEYFRDQGMHVMLMMDSITRMARAQREVGLAAGELPANRGFPPSVYAMLPALVERAGPSASGTITGMYTVLVEGDDMLEPIADSVRATLDGHIVLSRSLAERNHYPAIDINLSVSRSMNDIIDERHRKLADTTRRLLRTWAEVSDLVAVGAYEAGGDPWVDAAVAVHHQLGAFLRQRIDERTDPAAALSRLGEIAAAAEAIAERG